MGYASLVAETSPVEEATEMRVELGTTVEEVAGAEEELEEAGQRSAVPSILLTTQDEASSV